MGLDLRLTAIRNTGLPFSGRCPRVPCNYMDHYLFSDPGGTKGWVGLVGWPIAETLLTNLSHVNLTYILHNNNQRALHPIIPTCIHIQTQLVWLHPQWHEWRYRTFWSGSRSRTRIRPKLQFYSVSYRPNSYADFNKWLRHTPYVTACNVKFFLRIHVQVVYFVFVCIICNNYILSFIIVHNVFNSIQFSLFQATWPKKHTEDTQR